MRDRGEKEMKCSSRLVRHLQNHSDHVAAAKKNHMHTRLRFGLTACGLSVAALLAGCQPQNQLVVPPPPKVTVAVPLEKPVQEYFETTGQTRSARMVELRARVGGYLQKINFQDGDLVEEGQLLFVIDPAPYNAAVASAEAALARAQAQQRLAERQMDRTRLLAEQKATTESTMDIQKAELDSAAADVAAAEAALKNVNLNLSYTTIHAPFKGRIGRHMVDAGNLVRSEDTLLATLSAVHPIHAYFTVSETEVLRYLDMQREQGVTINAENPLPVEMALGEAGEFSFPGKLNFNEFGLDPETGTTERRAEFDNPEGRLVPGMFVKLRTPVGGPHPRLLVEERAVGSNQLGDYLLVVDAKNVVETRIVKLGILQNGLRVIHEGLRADDRVVINGLQKARPGGEVKPNLVQMGAALVKDAKPAANIQITPVSREDSPPSEDQKPAK